MLTCKQNSGIFRATVPIEFNIYPNESFSDNDFRVILIPQDNAVHITWLWQEIPSIAHYYELSGMYYSSAASILMISKNFTGYTMLDVGKDKLIDFETIMRDYYLERVNA